MIDIILNLFEKRMFNKHIFILFLLICNTSILSNAQIKPKEVDLQYQKYKNLKHIKVTTAEGTIEFEVSKNMNSNGKPVSITLVGRVFNESMGRNFVRKLGVERVRKGYQMSTVYEEILGTTMEVYTKGTEYSKYAFNEKYDQNKDNPFETLENKMSRINNLKEYIIYLEVGDISRKVTAKAENFSF